MKGTKFDDSGTRFTASTCGRTGSSKELGQKNGPPVHFYWREGVWTFFLAHEPHLKSRARGSARPSVRFGETSVHEEGLDIAEICFFFFSWTEK